MHHVEFLDHGLRQGAPLFRAAHLEGDHAGAVEHLALGQIILGMRWQAGVEHTGDSGMGFKPACDLECAGLMGAHSQGQCGCAACDEPSVEGRENAAVVNARLDTQLFDQRGPARNRAAKRIAMAADIFGGRMHHQIDTEGRSALTHGRGEGAVARKQRACLMGERRDGGKVGQAGDRIDRSFGMHKFCIGAQRIGEVLWIRKVDQRDLNAEPGQGFAREFGDAGIRDIGDHDVIACGEEGKEDGRGRRHAGSRGKAGIGPVKGGYFALEHIDSGIGPARVEEGAFGAKVMSGKACGRVDAEGGGHMQGRRGGACAGIGGLTRVDREGLRALVVSHGGPFRETVLGWRKAGAACAPLQGARGATTSRVTRFMR